jgi:hypothetical protein
MFINKVSILYHFSSKIIKCFIIYIQMSFNSTQLGGGFKGVSPKQTINSNKDSEMCMTRRVLRDSWNTSYATGTVNGYKRVVGGFKAVSNIGDFLSRQNYVCKIPNPQSDSIRGRNRIGSIINHCDNTGIPCSNTNTKFIPDSSEYIKYRKQRAINQNYNDINNG